MFNFQGGELVIILLLALVVLGPEKLPDAMRKAGSFYAELKKMSTGFQDEFRKAVDEPAAELRKTADLVRESADFRSLADGERPEKPKSAEMGDAPADAEADPDTAAPTFAGAEPGDAGAEATTETRDDEPAADPTDVADSEPTDEHHTASGEDRTGPDDTPSPADEPSDDQRADVAAEAPSDRSPEPANDDTIEVPKPRKNLIADANAFKPVDREHLDELRRKADQARRDYEAAQAELDGNVDS